MAPDPAYEYFLADAKAKGYPAPCNKPDHIRARRSCPDCKLLADYFHEIGVVPPANYGRPRYKDRELAQHDDLDRLASVPTWTGDKAIDKSWGEPGRTITVSRNSHEGSDD